ncbi:bifunctional 3'-5' exonuclease/DNA polymerase [Actinocorallia sp. A-T 12471]|uniref:bifunctional 3'-5' exonuclease/DNA polymerase n=1 Tax=Actinocorallia sp. A-T 12471 TaxID=3089813 RepID=UPI0029D09F6C|nr:bifunctional 3'-5' exonuclease/DNA polymerase [Actinocorallia sp. A-T 12471]MDX6739497.1 bifunctional 3'-5' exonuclease/DNA polymerase [Actinocorallia sp. A-T 12471]
MRIAVAWGEDGDGELQVLPDPIPQDAAPVVPESPPRTVPDLAAEVARLEAAEGPRWVWESSARDYARLLAAGVRVARCHDVELTEGLLLAREGAFGEPRSAAAALARRRGLPVPAEHRPEAQPSLFGGAPATPLADVVAAYRAQEAELGPLRLLAAAESAGGLAAAEMSHEGVPWRVDVHDELLTGLLGPRPAPGMRPRLLQDLADKIGAAFGAHVNPDSPKQLLKAFASVGHPVTTTRAWELRGIDHPAVAPVLEYKELARLYTAHGWTWMDSWVRDGRFRPEYVVGGVVSGRWASKGGGALQIPKVLRRAVVADPGWTLVVADAAQLEPRVLAALAGDAAFTEAAAQGDIYAALADAFAETPDGPSPRDKAKIAMLSAMYGGGTGEAVALLAVLRARFPAAFEYVESAARAGELGQAVTSLLGRASPAGSAEYRELITTSAGRSAALSRGRFTRNFVVQATAAEWALAFLALLRRELLGGPAEIVFFQHDEVIVHTPEADAEAVTAAVAKAADEAKRLLFGATPVVFPLHTSAVPCYADAK